MEVVIIIASFNNLGISKKRSTGTGVTGFCLEAVKVHEDFIDRRKDPFKCLQVEERTMMISVLLL